MTWNSFTLKTVLKHFFSILVLSLTISSNASAQTDEIQLKPAAGQTTGRIIRGTISNESPREVKIQVSGKTETVIVDDLANIDYANTPPAFFDAKLREKSGDYIAALESYKRAAGASGLRPFVLQLVKFRYASALADASLSDEKKIPEAIEALQDFVKSNPSSRHTPDAAEQLLNLVRSGSDPAKVDSVLADMAKIPGSQARSNILKADLLTDRGKPEEALKLLVSTKSQIPTKSELERFAQSVQINALVGQKNFAEAEKQARALIDSTAPEDASALAPAYNALGDCLRAAGKPKEALIAYLHTEILYDKVANEHARALSAIAQIWRILEKPDRAEQTLNKLASAYPRSPWLKKAQGVGKP